LFFANFEQGLIGDSFNISVPERVRAESSRVYRLRRGYPFLNLRADGAVIHEVAILDDFHSMIDRDLRILELAVGVEMSDPQLGDLTGGSGHACLVTLTAGLGVVKGPESIGGNMFYLLKNLLIGLASVEIGNPLLWS
jgi:hypothetical protein